MLCDRCKKKEATFHKSVIINGQGYETNLCQNCASKLNFYDDLDFSFDFDDLYDKFEYNFFNNFFSDDFFAPTMLMEKNSKTCPNCKSTFNDFLKRGRLGCSNCYDTFQSEIRDMLENMENPMDFNLDEGSEITPKQPTELEKLQKQFNLAVEEERYEEAGDLKKQINELLNKQNKEDK